MKVEKMGRTSFPTVGCGGIAEVDVLEKRLVQNVQQVAHDYLKLVLVLERP